MWSHPPSALPTHASIDLPSSNIYIRSIALPYVRVPPREATDIVVVITLLALALELAGDSSRSLRLSMASLAIHEHARMLLGESS